MYLDALRVKSREDSESCNKSVYVALGVNFEGKKEVADADFSPKSPKGCGQRKTKVLNFGWAY
jgi:transposase-like protein